MLLAEASGALSVDGFGVALQDLYGLVQRDTAGVAGKLGFAFKLGGTAREPTADGRAWLEDAGFGDFHAPFARTAVKYANRRLDVEAGLVRTGTDMLVVNAGTACTLSGGASCNPGGRPVPKSRPRPTRNVASSFGN